MNRRRTARGSIHEPERAADGSVALHMHPGGEFHDAEAFVYEIVERARARDS